MLILNVGVSSRSFEIGSTSVGVNMSSNIEVGGTSVGVLNN
ncbi:13821_t:CDS:2, partial [Dentiscutata erythropus]